LTGEEFWSGVEVTNFDSDDLAYRMVADSLRFLTGWNSNLCSIWPAWFDVVTKSKSGKAFSRCPMPGVEAHHPEFNFRPCRRPVCLLCRSRLTAQLYQPLRDAYHSDPYLQLSCTQLSPGSRKGTHDAKSTSAVAWVRSTVSSLQGKDYHRMIGLTKYRAYEDGSDTVGHERAENAVRWVGTWPQWAFDGRKFGTLLRSRTRGLTYGGLAILDGSQHAASACV